MFDDLIIKEDSKIEAIANIPQRRTNRGKKLGYGPLNPRNKSGDFKNNSRVVSRGFILLLKTKLELCTDYAERKVRLHIYNTLLKNKINDIKDDEASRDIDAYKTLYGKYLVSDKKSRLKASELAIFNEIEDAYFMFSGSGLQSFIKNISLTINGLDVPLEESDPFISVESSIPNTINKYRDKLRKDIIYERICGEDITRDYIVEFTEITPKHILYN